MIEVAVGQEYLHQFHTPLRYGLLDTRYITSRVNHGGLEGFITPEQGAILLIMSHGNNLMLQHYFTLGLPCGFEGAF